MIFVMHRKITWFYNSFIKYTINILFKVNNNIFLQELKSSMAKCIIEHQKKVKEFREVYGSKVIGEITIDQVIWLQ